jgi:hypothetical protein
VFDGRDILLLAALGMIWLAWWVSRKEDKWPRG